MCLDVKLTAKEKAEFLAKKPDTFYVWKVVWKHDDGTCGPIYQRCDERFKPGRQKARHASNIWISSDDKYRAGFHPYSGKSAAYDIARYTRRSKVVRCTVRKQDVICIGWQDGHKVVVSSHLTFPKSVAAKLLNKGA